MAKTKKKPAPKKTTLTSILTPKEIAKQAKTQVNTETAGAIAPLKSQQGILQGQQSRAVGDVSGLYDTILPFAERSAERTGEAADQTAANVQAVFNAAGQRLGQLRGDAAAGAQALAQQIGGPVPLELFTNPAASGAAYAGAEAGGGMLQTLGLGAAAKGEAEAYAGKVFPMMKVRDVQAVTQRYDDRIKTLQDQIDALNSGKAGNISKRQQELMVQERTYALQKTQADRDWWVAKHAAKIEESRVKQTSEQMEQTAKLQTQAEKATARENALARDYDAKQKALDRAAAKGDTTAAREIRQERQQQKQQAYAMLTGFLHPGSTTKNVQQQIGWTNGSSKIGMGDPMAPQMKNGQFVTDKDGNILSNKPDGHGGYLPTDFTQPTTGSVTVNVPTSEKVTNPDTIYHRLIQSGVPPQIAEPVVQSAFPNWDKGKTARVNAAKAKAKKAALAKKSKKKASQSHGHQTPPVKTS